MTNAELEARLRDYYESWAHADPEKVMPFFCEDSVFEDLAFEVKFEGLEAIRSFVDLTFSGAPDFRIEPQTIVVSGTQAAAAWIMSGTHDGDYPGLPATGKGFRVRASSIVEFRGSTILRMVDYWNPISFQKEVGLGS